MTSSSREIHEMNYLFPVQNKLIYRTKSRKLGQKSTIIKPDKCRMSDAGMTRSSLDRRLILSFQLFIYCVQFTTDRGQKAGDHSWSCNGPRGRLILTPLLPHSDVHSVIYQSGCYESLRCQGCTFVESNRCNGT
jgi:hypothetical protein